jgi:glycosyltransferase involved in cell wall biosynthesis
VLVAGTPFIRYALEFSLSGVLVIGAHCPSRLPGPIAADRARFGLPADKVVFLTAFEPYSDSARKNPEGTVKAFLRVAGRDDRVHLIVKVNMPTEAQEHPSVTRLRELTGGSATVSFLTASHTHEEVLRLYASVDVVVSLHRGEGLGLVPMEAMALGKPVIATAWSGNMAYMDHRSACLVGYRLVPVKGSGGLYERLVKGLHVLWAEPDLDAAADWMQRLADDAALRAFFGAAGREAVRRYQTVAAEGSFLDELAILYERRSIVCKGSLERQRQLAAIARAHRRELFLHKLTSPEAWRMFARHRLARLSGTREA